MMIKIFSVLLLILCTTLCMEMQHDDTCSKNIRLFSSSDGGLADPFKMICTDAMSLFEAGLMESCFRPEPEHPFFMSLKTIYLTDGAYKRLIERQMQLDNIYGDVKLSVHKMTSIKYPCTCAELHSYLQTLEQCQFAEGMFVDAEGEIAFIRVSPTDLENDGVKPEETVELLFNFDASWKSAGFKVKLKSDVDELSPFTPISSLNHFKQFFTLIGSPKYTALLESIDKASSEGPTTHSNLIEVDLDDGQFFDALPVFETILDESTFSFKTTIGAVKEIAIKANGPGGRPSIFIKVEVRERCCSNESYRMYDIWSKAIETDRYLFVEQIVHKPVTLVEGIITVKVTKTAIYKLKCINSLDGSSFLYGPSGTVKSYEAFNRTTNNYKKRSSSKGVFLGLRNVEALKADNCLGLEGPYCSAWSIFKFLARTIFFSADQPTVRNVLKHLDGISLLAQSSPGLVLHHFHFKPESLQEFGIEVLGKELADLIFANDPSVLIQLGIQPLDGPVLIKIVENDLAPIINTDDIAVFNLIGGTYHLILKEYLSNPSALSMQEKTMAFAHLDHLNQHQNVTFKSETIVKIPASTIQEHIKLIPSDGFLRIDMIKGDSLMISKGTVVPDPVEGNKLYLQQKLSSFDHFRTLQACLSQGSFAGPASKSSDTFPIHLKCVTPDQPNTMAEVALKENFESLVKVEWNSDACLSLVFSSQACIQNIGKSLMNNFSSSHDLYNFDDSTIILPKTTLSLCLNHQSVLSQQRWVALSSPSEFYSQTNGKQAFSFAIRRNWPSSTQQLSIQHIQSYRYSFKTGKNKLSFRTAIKILLDLIFGKKHLKFQACFSELHLECNKGSFLVTLYICAQLSSETAAIQKFMSNSLRPEAPNTNIAPRNNTPKQRDLPKSFYNPELDWKEYQKSLQKEISETEHFNLEEAIKNIFDPEAPDFGEGLRLLMRGDGAMKKEPKEFHRWTPLSREIELVREQMVASPYLEFQFTFSPSNTKPAPYTEEASFSVLPEKLGIYMDALESLVFSIVGLRLRPIVKRFGSRVNSSSPDSVILYVDLYDWDAIPQGHQLMTYFGDAWSSVERFAAKSLE